MIMETVKTIVEKRKPKTVFSLGTPYGETEWYSQTGHYFKTLANKKHKAGHISE